jgi:outer membrane protein assembly factor BamE (lipoprotein component of BamABCDE complex)
MHSLLSRLGFLFCFGMVLAMLPGCMSSSSGTATLTADRVNEIKKGVTTRQEIEAMFGPPAMVSMMGNGKHMMNYNFSQSDVHPSAAAYIPVVNIFATGAEGQIQNRTLQVNLDAHDVVEDYQFNDSTNNVQSTGGMFGNSSVTSTPAPSHQ